MNAIRFHFIQNLQHMR